MDHIIAPKLLDAVWPLVWPLIKDAVYLDTEEALKESVRAGEQMLVIVGDGCAIVRPGEIFWINYVGGHDAKDWWPTMSEFIDSMAKSCGAKEIAAVARSAWKRLAPDYEATEQRLYIKKVA